MNYNISVGMNIQGKLVGRDWSPITISEDERGSFGFDVRIPFINGRFFTCTTNQGVPEYEGLGYTLVSTDGKNWTRGEKIPFYEVQPRSIIYVPELGKYFISGSFADPPYSHTNGIMESVDGLNWTLPDSEYYDYNTPMLGLAYGNENIVASDASGNLYVRWVGGEWWNKDFIDPTFRLKSIYYVEGVGFVGYSFFDKTIWFSESGNDSDWEKQTFLVTDEPDNSWELSYGDGILFLTSDDARTDGQDPYYYYSTDGVNWNKKNIPPKAVAGTIIHHNKGTYIFVPTNAILPQISTDGETWEDVPLIKQHDFEMWSWVGMSDEQIVFSGGSGAISSWYSATEGNPNGGTFQFGVTKGYEYVAVINNSDNIVYLHDERLTNPNPNYALMKVYPYTQRTIPINKLKDQYTLSWVQGSEIGYKKADIIFSVENPQLNGSLGGSSNNVHVIGDSVGLARRSQFPENLDSDRVKVVVKNTVGEPLPITGSITARMGGGDNITTNTLNVTTSGTRVRLPNIPCQEVTIIARRGNTGYIYVGGNDVSDSVFGVELAAKESMTIPVSNASMIYIDSSVNGEGISYVAV